MRVFLDLMWYFRTRKRYYFGGIFVLVIVALLNLVPPQIVGLMVDHIQKGTLTRSMLLRWLLIMLATGLAVYGLRYIWRVLLFGSAIRLSTLLRSMLYEHFTKMSPQFYHNKRVGDLMAHSTNDIQAVEATAADGILTLVDSITTGTIVIATMAITIKWQLTVIALLPMPIMAWTTSYYGKLLHARFHKAQAAFADINDRVQENISGARVIKAFGQEEVEEKEFAELSADVVAKNVAVAKVDALFEPTISIIVGFSFFLTIAVGSIYVIKHSLSIGELTTFTMYLGQLIWPMLAFGWLFNIVERGRASNDRIRTLLAETTEIVDPEDALHTQPSGSVTYQVQTFRYPNASEPTLRDVRFSVAQGQTLGIVGKTGSGKTTLLRLLLREFDCHDGNIEIGHSSIYRYSLDSLRSAVGYVPQDHFLFSATIAENIAFARPTASMADIQAAAKTAAIHDDIMRFPDGYATVVGERGVTLSGGQKQRISIARALLLDAEVLILDDSLSAVDAKTEVHILDELRANRKNKTTFIAAHRLSAVEHADLIIVLENGQITERGTHIQLMEEDGWYAAMYQRQQLEEMVEQGGVLL